MKYFVADAFSNEVFGGNPAGVLILDYMIDDDRLQKIAAENNLSETAFVLKKGKGSYDLRWFTPKSEINLCGHATLASAFVVSNFIDPGIEVMSFDTMSGILEVRREKDLYVMNFPSLMSLETKPPESLEEVLGVPFLETFLNRDLLVLVEDENIVRSIKPDFDKMSRLNDCLGVIVTARGTDCEFVSRCFYPKLGVEEDPVTGSAHSMLAPFWAGRLGKNDLVGRQLSMRGGTVLCKVRGDRVDLSGKAVLYLQGELVL